MSIRSSCQARLAWLRVRLSPRDPYPWRHRETIRARAGNPRPSLDASQSQRHQEEARIDDEPSNAVAAAAAEESGSDSEAESTSVAGGEDVQVHSIDLPKGGDKQPV